MIQFGTWTLKWTPLLLHFFANTSSLTQSAYLRAPAPQRPSVTGPQSTSTSALRTSVYLFQILSTRRVAFEDPPLAERVRVPRASRTGTGVGTWIKVGLAGEPGQKSLGPVQNGTHTGKEERDLGAHRRGRCWRKSDVYYLWEAFIWWWERMVSMWHSIPEL